MAPFDLLPLDAGQRHHEVREGFNALRWIVRTGTQWRLLPHDFPSRAAAYQQTQRWLAAGCFETLVEDLRALLRLAPSRHASRDATGLRAVARRWVVERNFARKSRFHRLVPDYERLPTTVRGLHFVAFACLMLHQGLPTLAAGS